MIRRFSTASLGALLLSAVHADTGDLKHPDWHPDGRLLVSEGSCAGNIGLYLIDSRTGDIRLLFDSEHIDGYPRWFPDGKRIAFHRIDDKRQSRIHIAELSEAGAVVGTTSVTKGPFDIEPAPSPDGQRLAYSVAGDGGREIYVQQLDYDVVTRLTNRPGRDGYPKISPGGTQIAYHSEIDGDYTIVTVLNLESGERTLFDCSNFSG